MLPSTTSRRGLPRACVLNRGLIWGKQMKCQTPLPQSLPTLSILNTSTTSAENTESPPLTTSSSGNTPQTQGAGPAEEACSSEALSCNLSPLLWSLWQGTAVFWLGVVFFFHHFWGQILHSTAVFVYKTRNEGRTHTLDPAVFLLASPPSRLHNIFNLVVQLLFAIGGSQEGG